jgi:hypothetical protein
MFDASEVLFLDTAVDLHLLTPNQRGRLLEFQHSLEPGMSATTLVVDAGLMSEDEVHEVLQAIAGQRPKTSGSSRRTAESMGRTPKAAVAPDTDPVVNRFGTTVTGSELSRILDDDEELSEDQLEELFASLPGVDEPVEVPSAEDTSHGAWEHDPYGGAAPQPDHHQQAFPMPGGGAQPAFPLPEGAAGADQQQWHEHQAAEGHGDWQDPHQASYGDDQYQGYGEQQGHTSGQQSPAEVVRQAAARLDEIDLGLDDDEDDDEET